MLTCLPAVLVLWITGAFPCSAQTLTWIGGDGQYFNRDNWDPKNFPDSQYSIVIDNGGTVRSASMNSANQMSVGNSSTLDIQAGINSQFEISEEFYLGTTGLGTLQMGSESLLAAGDFYAAYGAGSSAVVQMTNAFLSPFRTYLGYAGRATLTIAGGSTLKSTTGYMGYLAGSNGVLQLTNSTWEAEDADLPRDITVGVSGRGEIQASGATISSLQLVLGLNTGSTGIVNAAGGTITVQEGVTVGNSGYGELTLTNSATLTANSLSVGATAGTSGLVSVTDSTVTISEDIFVGFNGTGTLETDNAQIEARELFIGRQTGSTGRATLSGGHLQLSGELHVGALSNGTLTLEGGGTIQSLKGNTGFEVGTTGTININDGEWTTTQAIFIGVSGNGTLNIGAQGEIKSESGYIGQAAGGEGTVNQTGGSWTMTNTLAVGVNGTGEYSATGGGVSSQWSQVGLNAGSHGTVTVDNASWTTTQTLTIGAAGQGEFSALNGATVSARAIELGGTAGVTGTLTVTNATLVTESILKGGGNGSVEFSGAQLNLLGGSEVVDSLLIYGFAPTAVVVGSGGLTVNTQGGNAQIASTLSGTGGLTKTGAGRLRLTTQNTISGGTTVSGGALEITGNSALGTGTTTVGGGELRAIADITLSDANAGSPPTLAISSNQTGTFSATAGNTFSLATSDFHFGSGSTLQTGSAGNTGTVVFAPENLTVTSTISGVSVQAGTLAAGNDQLARITSRAASTTVAAGATLDFQDNLPGGGIDALFGSGTVNTGTLSTTSLVVNSGNFAGNIAGNGALVKETSGTLILSGQNAFIGGTTVNAGTLVVNGDISFGMGQVAVNTDARLTGNGITGAITLSGGTLAPGTMTAQDLLWEDGDLEYGLGANGTASGLLSVGLFQGLGTTYAFTFINHGWTIGSTYSLINFSGTNITDPNVFSFTNGGGFDGDFSFDNNTLNFTMTVIPEPSSFALIVGAMVAAWLLRKRRISRGA